MRKFSRIFLERNGDDIFILFNEEENDDRVTIRLSKSELEKLKTAILNLKEPKMNFKNRLIILYVILYLILLFGFIGMLYIDNTRKTTFKFPSGLVYTCLSKEIGEINVPENISIECVNSNERRQRLYLRCDKCKPLIKFSQKLKLDSK